MAELSYPLGAGARTDVRSATGKAVAEITLDAAVSGSLSSRDVAISAETLRLQADFAERGGNPQLGENLRRAAELVAFDGRRAAPLLRDAPPRTLVRRGARLARRPRLPTAARRGAPSSFARRAPYTSGAA